MIRDRLVQLWGRERPMISTRCDLNRYVKGRVTDCQRRGGKTVELQKAVEVVQDYLGPQKGKRGIRVWVTGGRGNIAVWGRVTSA